MKKPIFRTILIWMSSAFAGLLVVLFLWIFFTGINTTFNIDANTERIEFSTPLKSSVADLQVVNANYAQEFDTTTQKFSGTIVIDQGVKVEIERIAGGPVFLSFKSLINDTCRVTTFKYLDEATGKMKKVESFGFADVAITDVDSLAAVGITHIFGFKGFVSLGRHVAYESPNESTALLRGGRIVMTSKSHLGSENVKVKSYDLALGDVIEFDQPKSEILGFLTINENPAMSVSCRVHSDKAYVSKMGPKAEGARIEIGATYYDRFFNDGLSQGLSLVTGLLLILISFTTFYYDSKDYLEVRK